MNALMFERSRTLAIADVKERGRVAHAEVLETIAALDDADLARTLRQSGADYAPEGRLLIDKVAGDTYAHYAEHVEWIGNLLQALER